VPVNATGSGAQVGANVPTQPALKAPRPPGACGATAPRERFTNKLNGEPLTVEHGAPWRLVVSGGPCYANVKWLDHLELAAESGEHTAQRIARGRLS
jgi:Oxidoreductase molybdopterin binding domain